MAYSETWLPKLDRRGVLSKIAVFLPLLEARHHTMPIAESPKGKCEDQADPFNTAMGCEAKDTALRQLISKARQKPRHHATRISRIARPPFSQRPLAPKID